VALPKKRYNEKIWHLWLRSERGPITTAFGDYEEAKEMGEIHSRSEIESLWRKYYPDKLKWYDLSIINYKNQLFFGIDSTCRIEINKKKHEISGIDLAEDETKHFFLWMLSSVEKEMIAFISNPVDYNNFLSKNLPLKNRYGKIKRSVLWENIDSATRLDKELGPGRVRQFEKAVNEMDENGIIKEMTANDFFSYCEICYDANNYFENSNKKLFPIEKYKAFADGRHDGLVDIKKKTARRHLENGINPIPMTEVIHGKSAGAEILPIYPSNRQR
jgi:hypothetical protein